MSMLRAVLCLLAQASLAIAPVVPDTARAAEPPPVQKVQLQSVQAHFYQEKQLKILAQPITSRGVFAFQAPRSLRWEYLFPVRSLLLIHGSSMKKLVEQDGKMVNDPGMAMDSMQLVLEEITNWLAGRFTENEAFNAAFPDEQTIVLTPKDAGLAAIISQIDMHLAGSEGLIESVIIHEGPDAFTRLTFSEAVLNEPLAETLFTTP